MQKNILSVFIFIIFLLACSKDVAIFNKNFSCENSLCVVTFEIENKKYEELDRKISISLSRQKDIGKGALVNDVLGEKRFVVHLKPNEKKEIEEPVKLIFNRMPSMLILNDYPVK